MEGFAGRKVIYKEITAESVLRTNAHVDGGWFWSKYSASPYRGCQYGCTYCFLREKNYGLTVRDKETQGLDDPFSQFIRVQVNAAEVLDKELERVQRDIIIAGDYQPAESKYRISRKLLQVCLKHKFPAMVVAKSPLVLSDADVLQQLSKESWACVVFSVSSAASKGYLGFFEPFASSIESRFLAMKKLSGMGVYTGTALMPILPFITDSDENLETIVRLTKENGGSFVLAGGLVLSDEQAKSFYTSLGAYGEGLVQKYKRVYQGNFSPRDNSWQAIGKKIKSLCEEYGLDYRIKRFIPDSPMEKNKRKSTELFLKVYEMELEGAPEREIKRLRETAWKIDEKCPTFSSCTGT